MWMRDFVKERYSPIEVECVERVSEFSDQFDWIDCRITALLMNNTVNPLIDTDELMGLCKKVLVDHETESLHVEYLPKSLHEHAFDLVNS